MDTATRQRILQLNPWFKRPEAFAEEIERRIPKPFIPRLVRLTDRDDPRKAKLIVGPRQAGKSTYVWSVLRSAEPGSILMLNSEEALVRRWLTSAVDVVSGIEEYFPTVRTVFIEEAQHLEDAGLLVKGIVDLRRGLNLFVTGSSAFHLEARTRESLAGRVRRVVMLPLCFAEVRDATHDPEEIPAVAARRVADALRRHLTYGGYPDVWLTPDPERELADLIEAFVIRDASDRHRIQRPDAFRALLSLAAGQIGRMVNYSEWAERLQVAVNTVRDYVQILEDAWILRRIPAFAGGARREITSAVRVHLCDIGLRNALLRRFPDDLTTTPDAGAIAEGWTYSELAKNLPLGAEIRYWRAKGGAEMDFVIRLGDRLAGIEVKVGGRPKLTRSMRSFIAAYAPRLLVVVLFDIDTVERTSVENTAVVFVSPHQLAATIAQWAD